MHILLGAINKTTNEYIYPKIANKNDNHICFECNRDVILCKGNIRIPYFRHKSDNRCDVYTNPSETQIHKDAKMLIKKIIEDNKDIIISRLCNNCKTQKNHIFTQKNKDLTVKLEYSFEYNGRKIADVACIDKSNNIYCIFEIYNTHKTIETSRPEPWFEINAKELISEINKNTEQLTINCLRNIVCDQCINIELKKKELENVKKNINDILTKKRLIYIETIKECTEQDDITKSCLRFLISINPDSITYTKNWYIIKTLYENNTIRIKIDCKYGSFDTYNGYQGNLLNWGYNNSQHYIFIDHLKKWYYEKYNSYRTINYKEINYKKDIKQIIEKINIINIKHQIKYYKKLLQDNFDDKYKKKIYELINLLKLKRCAITYIVEKNNDILIQNEITNEKIKITEYNDKSFMTIYSNSNHFYRVTINNILRWYNSSTYNFLSKIYINVEYKDKEDIKKLKGKFDPKLKCWYIFSNNYWTDDILKRWEVINTDLDKS